MAAERATFPAFLTHDWGKDERGRNNHHRVVQLAANLKKRGLPVWIDEHEMTGDIVKKMCQGIENSDVVVVFITQRYVDKVGGNDAKDNCQLEFNYAARKSNAMIPVVMEERMSNSYGWSGPVAFQLGGHLYTKMWEDADLDGAGLEKLIAEILKRAPAWSASVTPSPTAVAAASPQHSAATRGTVERSGMAAAKTRAEVTGSADTAKANAGKATTSAATAPTFAKTVVMKKYMYIACGLGAVALVFYIIAIASNSMLSSVH